MHYGSSTEQGHFVSYVFNADKTATLYDDTIVQQCDMEEILISQAFMQNVYMCFYVKGDRWPGQLPKSAFSNYVEKRNNVPWHLNECDVQRVDRIWKYEKKIMYNIVNSFDLNTVKPFHWLNGDVINSFLTGISQDGYNNCKNVHCFNSYLKLVHSSLAVDPKEFDILMLPVNVSKSHWTLLVFYPNSLLLCYYDFYHNINMSAVNSFAGF